METGLNHEETDKITCYLMKISGNTIIKELKDIFYESKKRLIDNLCLGMIPLTVLEIGIKEYLLKNHGIYSLTNGFKIFKNKYYFDLNENILNLNYIINILGFNSNLIDWGQFLDQLKIRMLLFLEEDMKLLNRIADKILINNKSSGIFYYLFELKNELYNLKTKKINFQIVMNIIKIFDLIKKYNQEDMILKTLNFYFKDINNLSEFISKKPLYIFERTLKYKILIEYYPAYTKIIKKININDVIDNKFNLILDEKNVPSVERILNL